MRIRNIDELIKNCGIENKREFETNSDKINRQLSLLFGERKLNYEISGEYDKCLNDLTLLQMLFWGGLSLTLGVTSLYDEIEVVDKSQAEMLYQSLLSTITNNVVAIHELVMNGLDHPAGVISRSNYELCMLLLTITLDREKLKKYFQTVNKDDGRKIWHENFRLSAMNKTISEFETSLSKKMEFYSEFRRKKYSEYSSHVHNDLFTIFSTGYKKEKGCVTSDKKMDFQIYGGKPTRISSLESLSDALFFTWKSFFKILFDKHKIRLNTGAKKENVWLWNFTMELQLIIKDLYFKMKFLGEKQREFGRTL